MLLRRISWRGRDRRPDRRRARSWGRSRRVPLPDPLPGVAARSRDAGDDRTAVTKELAQLDVDLLDEEVKAIRAS